MEELRRCVACGELQRTVTKERQERLVALGIQRMRLPVHEDARAPVERARGKRELEAASLPEAFGEGRLRDGLRRRVEQRVRAWPGEETAEKILEVPRRPPDRARGLVEKPEHTAVERERIPGRASLGIRVERLVVEG